MKTKLLLLLFCFTVGNTVLQAQEIVTFELKKSFTADQIKATYGLGLSYDIDVYYTEYTTKNVKNEIDTASGLIVIPNDATISYPIMVYEHGTVGGRNDAPSRFPGEEAIGLIISTYGYITILPDYIGLGISPGLHPYIHPETEASATIDMIKAAKTLEPSGVTHFNDQLFVTGYSQGGHAAMATCRALQNEADLTLTAATCCSGPYSVSKEMFNFTLSDEPYSFLAYIASVFLSAKLTNPEILIDFELEDVFQPQYATLMRQYENEKIGLFDLNSKLVGLLSTSGVVRPNRLFIEEVKNNLLSNPNHPIRQALKNMDVHDWTPTAPIRLLYCTSDDQVTYRNAVYADSIMAVNGSTSVKAIDVLTTGTHGTCYSPTAINTVIFFNSMQELNPSSTSIVSNHSGIQIYPNPTHHYINIMDIPNSNNYTNISIYDIYGKKVGTHILNPNTTNLRIEAPKNNGVYSIQINNKNKTIDTQKIVVIR